MRLSSEIKEILPAGLLMDGEKDAIYRLSYGMRQAIDLGTFRGLSAAILSFSCKSVHTFDVFEGINYMNEYDTNQYKDLHKKEGHNYADVKAALSKFTNITVCKKETAVAGVEWSGGVVDVLFVDADHSEIETIRNVMSWLPKMSAGGRIIFHDNNDIHPEVQSAIKKLSETGLLRFFDPGYDPGSIAVCEVIGK